MISDPLTTSEVRLAIDKLSRYYQRRISDYDLELVSQMWIEDLGDRMGSEQFDVVVKRYRKHFNKFPRPADLILCMNDPRFTDQQPTADKVVLDGITGRYKWHDNPDGTEYISLKEFKRRNPDYAAKLARIGGGFNKIIQKFPREPGEE